MKVLIVDDINRERGFSDSLKKHLDIKIQKDNFNTLDFTHCKIIFKHDTFNHQLSDELKPKIIYIEFTGGGTLKNEIESNSDGYKFKAKIENPEQVNNVLDIIDKPEFTKDDLEMILNFDTKLEELLKQFESINPLANKDLKAEKAKLQERVNELLKKA